MKSFGFFNTPILTQNEFSCKIDNYNRIDPISRVNNLDSKEYKCGDNYWTSDRSYARQELYTKPIFKDTQLFAPKIYIETSFNRKEKNEDLLGFNSAKSLLDIPHYYLGEKKKSDWDF